MADIKAGRYKAKGLKGSEQYGEAGANKTLQIAVDLAIKELGNSMTTFLFFSPAAAPYSFQRLTALGWKGKTAADLVNLDGIDANEVDVEIREDTWEGKTTFKCEILTGPGRVTLESPVDKNSFAARVAALVGNASSTSEPAAGPVKPPF